MTTKIIVNGAKGRMGSLAAKAINAQPDMQVVAELTRGDDLSNAIHTTKPDIVVDFTNADVAFLNTKTILEAGVNAVIGTTGFIKNQVTELTELCESKKNRVHHRTELFNRRKLNDALRRRCC